MRNRPKVLTNDRRESARTDAPRRRAPQGEELEFLPAVLEVSESPPSPIARVVALTLAGVFAAAILWAIIGTIDVVAVARGKIIPSGYSKVIQPLESGIIRAIHVRDGQAVKAGDLLIELDPTTSQADEQRLLHEHQTAQVEIARLRALIAGKSSFEPPKGADPAFVALQHQMLRDQWAEYRRRLDVARLTVEQRQAAVEVTKANIARLEAVGPIANRRRELMTARVEVARLRALLSGREAFQAPAGADPEFVALQQRLLRDQLAEHRERLRTARIVVEQRQAAAEATKAEVTRLEAVVPIVTQNADAYKRLFESDMASRMQYLEFEEKRIAAVQALAAARHRLAQDTAALAEAQRNLHVIALEFTRARTAELSELEARAAALAEEVEEKSVTKSQDLVAQRHRLIQDIAALAEAQEQHRLVESEFMRARLGELSELETRAASLGQEVVKAARRSTINRLTAPIEGIVQQMAVHTVGGVVTPAQPLMVIVPGQHSLEVEAFVENKDIGFIAPGQVAEVKVDSFPFTRHGTINGTVTTVSRDAVPQQNGGLVYAMRVGLERSTLQVEGKPVTLSPGMAVTVDIKTGRRRLIEFFLSPLLRYGRESARER